MLRKYIWAVVLLSAFTVMSLVVLAVQANTLQNTQITLTVTQSELTSTQAESQSTSAKLASTQAELAKTQTESASTQVRLTQAESELSGAKAEIARLQFDLTGTQAELIQTQTSFTAAQNELKMTVQKADLLQTDVNNLQARYDSLQTNYDRLVTGYGYVFKDPTYQSMKAFLEADKTNERKYDITNYDCQNFCADVTTNAARQKIRCAYVAIDYKDGEHGHSIVAFNTTDKGIIYIEPQTDEEVTLQIGKNYYQCVIPKPGYYYPKPSYDDSIDRFIVIW